MKTLTNTPKDNPRKLFVLNRWRITFNENFQVNYLVIFEFEQEKEFFFSDKHYLSGLILISI
jgi:hypothetical protein